MIVVAVTGGIGSGKSTVAGLLGDHGAVVVDADQIARQVVEPQGPALAAVAARFGPDVLAPDGSLDRAAVAARVFSDPEALADLNGITHPHIAAGILVQVARHAGTNQVVVLDIPLLSPASRERYGLAGVIVVDTPVEVAIRRLVDGRALGEADARARIEAQIGREERCRLADLVIDNSGTCEDLADAVDRAWAWISGLG